MACPVAVTPLASNSRRLTAAGGRCTIFLALELSILLAGCGWAPTGHQNDGRLPVVAGVPPLAYLGGADRRRARESRRAGAAGPRPAHLRAHARSRSSPWAGRRSSSRSTCHSRSAVGEGAGRQPAAPVVDRRHAGRAETSPWTPLAVRNRPMGTTSRKPHTASPTRTSGSSPPLLKIQAENIAAALCRADPAHQADYKRNLAALLEPARRAPPAHQADAGAVSRPGVLCFSSGLRLFCRRLRIEAGGGRGRRPIADAQAASRTDRGGPGRRGQDDFRSAAVSTRRAPKSWPRRSAARWWRSTGLGKDVIADIEDIATKIEAAMKREVHEPCRREPVISLRDVTFSYGGAPALEDVNCRSTIARRCASSGPTAAGRRRW